MNEYVTSDMIVPVAMTGRSIVFQGVNSKEHYYATKRVANDILAAQSVGKKIQVWVQRPEIREGEDSPSKPWQLLSWLATPSRF